MAKRDNEWKLTNHKECGYQSLLVSTVSLYLNREYRKYILNDPLISPGLLFYTFLHQCILGGRPVSDGPGYLLRAHHTPNDRAWDRLDHKVTSI